ncbi:ELMO/CED-12 family [Novymonas esmeraldas]|uniref:ELMO/CED-12 family n=1 Tax=Novymonas esmeraldas TaxID=1808958 RepID=A0AAW0EWM9_9TRYP
MRQRKGVSTTSAPPTGAAPTAYVDAAHLGSVSGAHERGVAHDYQASARAGMATSETGTLQRRPSRLDEMDCSLYYTPQLVWLQVMDRVPYELSHHFVSALPPQHELMLRRIREQHIRAYSAEAAADVELLRRMWNGHNRVTFAGDELAFSAASHSVNDRWKEMGFQGRDPSTDFRGAGVFGLAQLVYLVERHPQQWSVTLSPDYLAGAAGLNVSMRLLTLLGINSSVNQFSSTILSTYSACEARLQLCRLIHDSDIDVAVQRLNEVYCFAMRLLHYRWMRSTRNIMEFNQQLSQMYKELERLLYVSKSLEELCELV